jgi:hypothetical protein
LLLPWIEILSRLRRLRIPAERALTACPPPPRAVFPDLNGLSDQIEEEGFEHLADVGHEDSEARIFYRIFRDAPSRTHAAICLAEQSGLAFYYLTVTSRLSAGKVFLTWNYPFSYGLKFSPLIELNRIEGVLPFSKMIEGHRRFLREMGIPDGGLTELDGAQVLDAMSRDFRAQVRYNIDVGLLRREGSETIRYTFRGMLYLWLQFLRDLFRFF